LRDSIIASPPLIVKTFLYIIQLHMNKKIYIIIENNIIVFNL